jgi:hypothetical protein
MNSDYERQLEAAVDRQLKQMPEWTAPATLAPRVLQAIQARAALAWYRRPLQNWPPAFQAVALVILLASFGGLCFGGWEILHAPVLSNLPHEIGQWFSGLSVIGNTCHAIAGALAAAAMKLGTGFMIGCVAALALGYAFFMAMGTVCVRLAAARR